MKQFTYVEDYIEVINGDRDPVTGKLFGLFDTTPAIISLARYDVSIVDSMSQAVQSGKSLTDKQADLAVKIILKYRKQLTARNVDVSPVENPKFRLGIREIDRRRLAYIDSTDIVLQFPYDTKLIDGIRDLSKLSQGRWGFDGNSKSWKLGITEMNVVAAHGFASNNQFEIDSEFTQLLKLVEECEAIEYSIELIPTDNGYTITNAHPGLLEYIENNCGGFDKSNLVSLVDNSDILGYTVSQEIVEQMTSAKSARVTNLMIRQQSRFTANYTDETILTDIVEYAHATNRWPIYVYEPDLSDRLYDKFVARYFEQEEIHKIRDTKTQPRTDARVIFFHKYSPKWENRIPLLISSAGIMHGGEKTMLLQRAEKVVYFAADVYNNQQRTKNISAS
jgi:hypothetical protein